MADLTYAKVEGAIDELIDKLWLSATDEISVGDQDMEVRKSYFRLGCSELLGALADLPDPVFIRVMAGLGLTRG